MNFVVIGGSDHGKSTFIQHLLFLSGSIDEAKYNNLKNDLKQTVDISQWSFKLATNNVNIIDTPGDSKYIENTITGTFQADNAIFIFDATRKEIYEKKELEYNCIHDKLLIAHASGIHRIIILINKMDQVEYSSQIYYEIHNFILRWVVEVGFEQEKCTVIPISGLMGDNITAKSDKMAWYMNDTFYTSIDKLKRLNPTMNSFPLRLPILNLKVVKCIGTFISGIIQSGTLNTNQNVKIMPMGFKTKVSSIDMNEKQVEKAVTGQKITMKTNDEFPIDCLRRGQVLCDVNDNSFRECRKFTATIEIVNFPGHLKKDHIAVFSFGVSHCPCKFISFLGKSNVNGKVKNPNFIKQGDTATVEVEPLESLAIGNIERNKRLSNFVVYDENAVVGYGSVLSVVNLIEEVDSNSDADEKKHDSDRKKPDIHKESEKKKPDINKESEKKKPEIHKESEKKKPDIQKESEKKKPGIQKESDEKKPEIHKESEKKKPDIPKESDEKKPDIHKESEKKKPDIPKESDEKKPDIHKESEKKKPDIQKESEKKKPDIQKDGVKNPQKSKKDFWLNIMDSQNVKKFLQQYKKE